MTEKKGGGRIITLQIFSRPKIYLSPLTGEFGRGQYASRTQEESFIAINIPFVAIRNNSPQHMVSEYFAVV